MTERGWLRNVEIGFDQLFNAVTGGSGDETISSRTGREGLGSIADRFMNLFQADHSVRSVEYSPWGTVDPHHMNELDLELAMDWDCLMQVVKSKQDADAFLPETMARAERAAKRYRFWTINGGQRRWSNRMARDLDVGDSVKCEF